MIFTGFSWIRLTQLLSLGLTKEQLYFIVIFIGIFTCYYIIQPIIHWFVALQSTKVISYLITSMLVLICMLGFSVHQSDDVISSLIRTALQSLAAFGCMLFIVRIFEVIVKRGKKKSV
ncbi:hypothetical protein F3157_20980 [Virgibacillus dakarensis]|uniref:Uncharacterized protein n=1 Tax=Lentibacillus populi TaxID=1827502 RepID=A0A9W5X737_9BACI|nr:MULTISPECIES: hypothetical protein [Bacillaceae]MTW88072.1 hypothetical protein [Virgibacillus dakarensis]GGB53381.1 hypothetical protein GCM10011409_33720 [Lentibacillus populi]